MKITAMTNYRHYIIGLLCACMTVCTANAQNGGNAKANMTPADSVKTMQKKLNEEKKLEAQLKKLKDAVAKVERQRDQLKANPAFHQNDSLTGLKSKVSSLRDSVKNSKEPAIEAVKKSCQDEKEQMDQQHLRDSLEVKLRRENVKKLKTLRDNYMNNLIKAPNEIWEPMPFSSTALLELEEECKQYADYRKDTTVAAAEAKMEKILAETRIYHNGVKALVDPYNANILKSVTNNVSQLSVSMKNATKKAELDTLLAKLNSYTDNIVKFQNLIKAVDHQLDGFNKIDFRLVKSLTNSRENDVNSIKTIPWLEKQFEQYFEYYRDNDKELKKDLPDNPARQTILDLKP